MVEKSGGSAAAEGMRRVWSEADSRGEKHMSLLSVGAASDLLLGEKAQCDGG